MVFQRTKFPKAPRQVLDTVARSAGADVLVRSFSELKSAIFSGLSSASRSSIGIVIADDITVDETVIIPAEFVNGENRNVSIRITGAGASLFVTTSDPIFTMGYETETGLQLFIDHLSIFGATKDDYAATVFEVAGWPLKWSVQHCLIKATKVFDSGAGEQGYLDFSHNIVISDATAGIALFDPAMSSTLIGNHFSADGGTIDLDSGDQAIGNWLHETGVVSGAAANFSDLNNIGSWTV